MNKTMKTLNTDIPEERRPWGLVQRLVRCNMELVEFKRNEIYCDTGLIARKFGMQHAKVTQAMKTLIPKLEDFRVTSFHPKVVIPIGKDHSAYLTLPDESVDEIRRVWENGKKGYKAI